MSDTAAVAVKAKSLHIETAGRHPDVIVNDVFEATVEDALVEPTFVIDMTDMPALTTGAHGVLVDRRGRDVRHGEFEVFSTWSPDGATRFASARFVDAGWFRRKIELGWSYWFARIPKRRMMSRPVPSFPASDSAKT